MATEIKPPREHTLTAQAQHFKGNWTAVLNSPRLRPGKIRLVSILIGLVCWEVFGRGVNPLFLAYPSAIWSAFLQMLGTGELVNALLTSLKSLLSGFLLAALFGILIGMLMGRYRLVEYSLDTYINALYATPRIALVPLIILWFGLGTPAKIFVVFISAVFPVLINTYAGVRNVDPSLIEVAEAFVATEREIFAKVVLPASVPFIVTGLRLAAGRAIIGMVVAEFFTAIDGLGGLIMTSANFFRTADLFVGVLVLMLMGVAVTEGLSWLERRLSPWRES